MGSKQACISPPARAIRVIRGCFLSAIASTALGLAGAGCSTPPKAVRSDPEIERHAAAARGAYAAGAAEKAAAYYRKALQRARVMDSAPDIARNAYNLAACLAALHSYDAAQASLNEARLEFERAGLPCRELFLLEAGIARAQGRLQDAVSLARAEQRKSQNRNDAFGIQWRLLLAELMCDQGQTAEAAAELAAIPPQNLKASGNEIQAETAQIRARVQMIQQNAPDAALLYDQAARHWQGAARYIEMAGALAQAGRAYESAGNKEAAADRLHRAARSLFASGRIAQARELAGLALPLAAADRQPDLQRQVKRLQAEIEARRPLPDDSP